MRNGGLVITLPKDNKNNLERSKSLGDCLYNANPMTAENSENRIRRVITEEKKITSGETRQRENRNVKSTACNWRRRKGHPDGSTPYPSNDRFLITEDGVPERV